jgi:hypothetical protein
MPLEAHKIAKLKRLLEEALQLLALADGSKRSTPKKKRQAASHADDLIFSLNVRAFMKRYGSKLSGTQKFTLLVARLAQGKVGHAVSLKEIESWWNKMKGILGGAYNPAHSTRAKDRGWVDSPKFGAYALSHDWKDAVGG